MYRYPDLEADSIYLTKSLYGLPDNFQIDLEVIRGASVT
jgi:hypothetical protein